MSNTPAAPAPPANAAISVRNTVATSKWLGATSLGSGKQIAAGDQVVMCPKCFKPVFLEDWRNNGSKCPEDGTPARVIERTARDSGDAGGAPVAAAAPAAPPAPAARPAAAAVPAAPAIATMGGPASATIEVDPYRNARNVEAPPVSDVWRRNIMTIFWMLLVWGVIVLVVWALGLDPTALRSV